MRNEAIETRGHTTAEGVLNLTLDVGLANADVAVLVQVRPLSPNVELDANGWPKGYFETVPGSMPQLQRAAQGSYEDRMAFE